MPRNKDDNLFNNPEPRGEKKKSSLIAGLFNRIKSKGEELRAAGRDFQAEKISLSDYKSGLNAGQSDRAKAPIANSTGQAENTAALSGQDGSAPASRGIDPGIKERVVVNPKRWRAPKILKTNLIRGEVTTFIDWKKNFLILSTSFLLSGLIVSVVFIGLVFWEIKEIEKAQALDDELRVLSQSIINAETEAQPVNTFESKLVLAKNLLGSHTNWSNYINFLEENLLKDVYLTSAIGADTKGKYSLSLKGKDFSDIEKQIKVFKNNELVKDVWVRSGKVAEANKNQLLINRGVDFNLDFELVDNFFKQ